jgi:hypothetical protein
MVIPEPWWSAAQLQTDGTPHLIAIVVLSSVVHAAGASRTLSSWARSIGVSASELASALSFLASKDLISGWDFDVRPAVDLDAAVVANDDVIARLGKGTADASFLFAVPDSELQTHSDYPGFQRFWDSYPRGPQNNRRIGKKKCLEIWRRKKLERVADQVITALESFKRTDDWRKSGGAFVPMTATFLNQDRWDGFESATDTKKPTQQFDVPLDRKVTLAELDRYEEGL